VVLVMMGVVGSGKTTVGTLLSAKLGWQFADADDFHPGANIDKIRQGIPLTDADRAPWLGAMRSPEASSRCTSACRPIAA